MTKIMTRTLGQNISILELINYLDKHKLWSLIVNLKHIFSDSCPSE